MLQKYRNFVARYQLTKCKKAMKYRFIGCLLLACLCVLSQRLTGQVIRLYTTQHGLKTNNCHSVDLDSRGFVWVSGTNSLGLFDGTKFQYLPTTTEDGRQLFQIVTWCE